MLWCITYNRIKCGVPFLLFDKFFTLVRVTAHGITAFAQVKNVSTKSLDVSLPPFHSGATILHLKNS